MLYYRSWRKQLSRVVGSFYFIFLSNSMVSPLSFCSIYVCFRQKLVDVDAYCEWTFFCEGVLGLGVSGVRTICASTSTLPSRAAIEDCNSWCSVRLSTVPYHWRGAIADGTALECARALEFRFWVPGGRYVEHIVLLWNLLCWLALPYERK